MSYADMARKAAQNAAQLKTDEFSALSGIKDLSSASRYSGFLPNADAFNARTQSQIDDILAQLPIGIESFNTDLASRGVFSAGEAPKSLYQNVYAPIARAATSAATEGQLGLEQARMQGVQAATNSQLQATQVWLNYIMNEKQLALQKQLGKDSMIGDIFGGLTSIAGAFITK